jgi:hypothetical protein
MRAREYIQIRANIRTVMSARAIRHRMSGGSAVASNLAASALAMRRGQRRAGGDNADAEWDDAAGGTDAEWEDAGRGTDVWKEAKEAEESAEAAAAGVAHSTSTQSAAPDTKSSGSCNARVSCKKQYSEGA